MQTVMRFRCDEVITDSIRHSLKHSLHSPENVLALTQQTPQKQQNGGFKHNTTPITIYEISVSIGRRLELNWMRIKYFV